MKAKVNNTRSNIDPVAVGTYPSRLVGAIDIGVQPRKPFPGAPDKGPINKVVFIYELVDEFLKDADGKDMLDKPRWQSETMAFYGPGAEKSTIGQRFAALDPSNAADGDVAKLIGTPVMVSITHSPKDKDSVYTNVESIAAMRPKDAERCPPLVNKTLVFDMDAPDMEVFDRIPPWIKKLITSALNYEKSPLAALVANAPKKVEAKAAVTKEELEEERPF